jgi:hypothetical protein
MGLIKTSGHVEILLIILPTGLVGCTDSKVQNTTIILHAISYEQIPFTYTHIWAPCTLVFIITASIDALVSARKVYQNPLWPNTHQVHVPNWSPTHHFRHQPTILGQPRTDWQAHKVARPKVPGMPHGTALPMLQHVFLYCCMGSHKSVGLRMVKTTIFQALSLSLATVLQ